MHARHQRWFQAAVIALAFALARVSSAPAQNQPDVLTIKSARVGIGGVSKAGYWTPIWLQLSAGPEGASGILEIVVPDGDNVPVIYAEEAPDDLNLQPNQDATILRYAKLGCETALIRVQLRAEGEVVWSHELTSRPTPLAATRELIVGIGPDLDLKGALSAIRRPQELALATVQVTSAVDLPDRWWGYEAVDQVVLATSDIRLLESVTADQRKALLTWLALGGRLVISMGSGGKELAAEGSPWVALVPGKLSEVSVLRERAGLEAFTGFAIPWEDDSFQRTRPEVTRLAEIDGTVLVDEIGAGIDRPLAIRAAHGLGQVVFVGLDLDHPGFAKWAGRPKLLASVLVAAPGRANDDETEVRRSITHLGYEDLVGQLRAALDQFPDVALVSFTTVSVLTALYLLLIGPGDYLLLTWLKIPRHVTWVTFALVAISFAAAACLLGRAAHGQKVRINQVEIVDLDAREGIVRGTAWAHLYSPATARYSLEPNTNSSLVGVGNLGGYLAWQGLPGNSLGGLGSAQPLLTETESYRILAPAQQAGNQQTGAVGLPVQIASSKSLSARWWGQRTQPITSSLARNEFGTLDGQLSNPFPVELTECLVAFEDRLYRLGKLAPGESVDMRGRSPLNLEARLTERTIEAGKEISTHWQRDSNDIPRIVQMLMFHEAARGRAYTGLTHRYQPYLDLSAHLRLHRAVLAGRLAQPVTRLVDAGRELAAPGETNAQTWCRVVFPVQSLPQPTNQP
jgi:hypothetical protein